MNVDYRALLTLVCMAMAGPVYGMNVASIRWSDEISAAEKARILDCFSGANRYSLDDSSMVVKENTGRGPVSEFFLNALVRDAPGPEEREALLVVVLEEATDCKVLSVLETPHPGEGIRRLHNLYALDFDRDGDLDVIDQRQFDVTGEDASFFARVLEREGNQLKPVYSAWSSGRVELQDLDEDERLELIETTNEFSIPHDVGYWKVLYRWNGTAYHEVSGEQYLEFYREQKSVYEQLLEQAKANNEKFKEKVGRPNPVDLTAIEAMSTYLARIRAMEEGAGSAK